MRKIRLDQGVARACYHDGFHDLGTFDEAPGTVQSPGVCADAQCCKITWLEELAFREQYYTGTRRIILGQVDSRPRPKKTICTFGCVFHQYLAIAQFVWDRAVCGARYWVGTGCGCSGVAQKIHMRKIRRQQGLVHDEEI